MAATETAALELLELITAALSLQRAQQLEPLHESHLTPYRAARAEQAAALAEALGALRLTLQSPTAYGLDFVAELVREAMAEQDRRIAEHRANQDKDGDD